jgi:hypothetical protein
MHLCTYRSLNHILIVYSSNVTNRPSLTRYVAYIARGVDLCQTLGGPNPFPPHPYPLPLLHPFPSSLLLLPFVAPSPPFPPLPLPSPPLGVRGLRPRKKFFRYTYARTRVLVHF